MREQEIETLITAADVTQNVRITLPAHVVAWFKTQAGLDGETGGTAWLELIERTLQAHVSDCAADETSTA